MATQNRAAQIKKTLKVLRKHYNPAPPSEAKTVLEHLVLGCCLENSPHAAAEQALLALRENYFDWNEVRVTTVRELADSLKMLNDPEPAARRVRLALQSVFESIYSFDLQGLIKENLGQAIKTLSRYNGATPFVVSYVTQMALGGHAIPVNPGLLASFVVVGIASESEAKQGAVPGLERAIPKNKGVEAGSVLHNLGVVYTRNPYGSAIRKLLLEIDGTCKDRLPKRPVKQEPPAPKTAKKKAATKKTSDKKPATKKTKKATAKKTTVKKSVAPRKKTAKTTTTKLSKKKPR